MKMMKKVMPPLTPRSLALSQVMLVSEVKSAAAEAEVSKIVTYRLWLWSC